MSGTPPDGGRTVSQIQGRLIELGLLKGSPDGISGSATKKAIRAFQRLHDLKPDAIVGRRTLAALWPPAEPWRDKPSGDPVHSVIRATPGEHMWPRQSDVPAYFGERGANQVMLQVPYRMVLAWDQRRVVRQFSIHAKVAASAARVLAAVSTRSPEHRAALGLDLFGGCLNVRKMTGGSNWSMHSWGIAIDFDPTRNQFGMDKSVARLAAGDAAWFLDLWEAEGWLSLGRARNKDWMHVQAARL